MAKDKKTIEATANQSARTFTLRVKHNGNLTAKFRTFQMGHAEFKENEYNTPNDWQTFLNTNEVQTIVI